LSTARTARPPGWQLDHRRLLLLVVFASIASFPLARATDIDFWWHRRTGALIADTGTVPTTDPFSYTAAGRPWVVHEWLWDLGIYWIVAHGGYLLAVLLSAVVLTCTFAILYRLLRRLGANEIAASVFVLWAAALALPCVGVRPREFTFLFFVIYVSRLIDYRGVAASSPALLRGRRWPQRREPEGVERDRLADDEAPHSADLPPSGPLLCGITRHGGGPGWRPLARYPLWLLPPLMVLWVNLHGGFVLGLGLLALYIAGEVWERWRAGAPLPRHLLAVGAATLIAALLNPQGPWRLLYPFGYYLATQGNPSFDIVTEFQSPSFHQPLSLLFACGILLLMLVGLRRSRPQVVEGLWAVAFTAQALVAVRQMSVAALVLAPLMVAELCERFGWMRTLPQVRLPRRLVAVNWLLLLLLIGAGAVYATGPRVAPMLQLGREPNPGAMPVAGADYIEQHQLPDPVFNEQAWGGYLISRWYPQRKVFIDGRIDMYGTDVVSEYFQVTTARPQWSAILDRYGVRTVLAEKDSALSVLLAASGMWERVFTGKVEDVFIRHDRHEPD